MIVGHSYSCEKLRWPIKVISVEADWVEEGKGIKRAKIFLHLERKGK